MSGITIGSKIRCIGNSGARTIRIFGFKGRGGGVRKRRLTGGPGDIFVGSVVTGAFRLKKIVQYGVITGQKMPLWRADCGYIRGQSNTGVLFKAKDSKQLLATKFKGIVFREVFQKIPELKSAFTGAKSR